MKNTITSILLAAILASTGLACSSSSNGGEPYRECVKDSDCSTGYKCEYNQCKRIIDSDGDNSGDCTDTGAFQCLDPGNVVSMCIAGLWTERPCVSGQNGACFIWSSEIQDDESNCCNCCDPSWDKFQCTDDAIESCDNATNTWQAGDCTEACLSSLAANLTCCDCCNPATDSFKCEEDSLLKCDPVLSMWVESNCNEACEDPDQPYLYCCECQIDGDLDAEEEYEIIEWEGGQDCTPSTIDPRCDKLIENFCFDDIHRDVYYCKDEDLWVCDLTCDPSYPNCGWITNDRKTENCPLACIDTDPENHSVDAYCEISIDGDEEIELEPEEEGDQQTDFSDGRPCTPGQCLPGSSCNMDWSDSAMYCAPDEFTCVFHVGMAYEDDALFYTQGDKVCVGNTYKRCSDGSWIQETTCAEDQTCVTPLGCQ